MLRIHGDQISICFLSGTWYFDTWYHFLWYKGPRFPVLSLIHDQLLGVDSKDFCFVGGNYQSTGLLKKGFWATKFLGIWFGWWNMIKFKQVYEMECLYQLVLLALILYAAFEINPKK